MPTLNNSTHPTLSKLLTAYPELLKPYRPQTLTPEQLALGIHGITSPALATPDSMVFANTAKALELALNSSATVICVLSSLLDALTEAQLRTYEGKIILSSSRSDRTMRELIQSYFLKTPYISPETRGGGFHPTACIDPTAQVAKTATVGPFAVIGAKVVLGEHVHIGASAVVERETVIGDSTVIHPLVYIGHKTQIGRNCEVCPNTTIAKEGFGYVHDHEGHHRIPHQGRVVIGDRVHIGSSCTIDRATFEETRIDSHCVIDNQVHIAHNCQIGSGSIITAGFRVAGSSKIGKRFVAGGNSTVTGHVQICDNVQLGGMSVVRKSITAAGSYAGNPLLPLNEATRMLTAMTRLPSALKWLRGLGKESAPET